MGAVGRDGRHLHAVDLVEAGIIGAPQPPGAPWSRPPDAVSLADRIAACRPSSRLLMPSIRC